MLIAALAIVTGCTHRDALPVIPDAAVTDLATTPTFDFAVAGPWTDFPGEPVFDTVNGVPPADAPSLFAEPGATEGGPCVVEPEPGTVVPLNWIRPRVRFVPAPGQNLFEIRFHAAREQSDLVVYTTSSSWTMPQGLWKALSAHIVGEPITITVRGAVYDGQKLTGPPLGGVPTGFTVAPVPVSGSIVYASATHSGMTLRGADIADEISHVVLRPSSSSGAQCIGCHAAAPDTRHVGFVQSASTDNPDRPSLGLRTVDGRATEPSWMTAAARLLLGGVGQGAPSFSRSHYHGGDRLMLAARSIDGVSEITWIDLEAASTDRAIGWDKIERAGDLRSATTPTFSHDGTSVLYVSATMVTGGAGVVDGDLMTVPWSSRLGGQAMPVAGAHDLTWNEYTPSLTPDDRYIAYARVPYGQSSQSNPRAEILVVPQSGGAPARLEANDPPQCLEQELRFGG